MYSDYKYFLKALLVFFFGFLAPALYAQDDCSSLAMNLSVEIKLEKHDYWAGDSISYKVVLHADDSSVLQKWKYIVITGGFFNDITGSASTARFRFDVKTDGVLAMPEQLIKTQLKENLLGIYKARGFFLRAEDDSAIPCLAGIGGFGDTAAIAVLNTFNEADIDGPVVKSRTFDRAEARVGDIVVLTLNISDKSGVCSDEISSTRDCLAVSHQGFATESGDLNMDFYEPLIRIDSEIFQVILKIPEDTKPGVYEMVVHNIYDVYGNSNVEIPVYNRPTIQIVD